jgi:hypothetical protein
MNKRRTNNTMNKIRRTNNTMNKRKTQTIQWTKEEDRQYNEQKKKVVLSVFFFCSLYCLCFSFVHCIVCPSSFVHCIVCLFLLFIVLFVLLLTIQWTKGQTIQWTKEGQTIQWTKEEGQTIQWTKEEDRQYNEQKKTDKQDYLFDSLSFYHLCLLITSLIVCPIIYVFWLPLW